MLVIFLAESIRKELRPSSSEQIECLKNLQNDNQPSNAIGKSELANNPTFCPGYVNFCY